MKRFLCIILSIAMLLTVINLIPPKRIENNPFLAGEDGLPMVTAHRGGGENNPENTMLAFREAVYSYDVDIIESDLWLTKDGYLVYNHDSYIDRTCNVNGDISEEELMTLIDKEENRHYIADMTLAELQIYNFGYYFKDENGVRIYKDVTDIEAAGLQIATAEQLLDEFYLSHPDLLFVVEIKNEGEDGAIACDKLNAIINNYPEYLDNVLIGTFHPEVEELLAREYPHLMRGASLKGAIIFILTHLLGVNLFDRSDFTCLQIPLSYTVGIEIRLDIQSLIDRAHLRGIAVQYWTVNDEDEMRRLIEMGVDGITTDNPALLREIINEYKAK